MLRKKYFLFIIILTVFILQSKISAFDGQRKGFFASLGIGGGVTYQESQWDWGSGNRWRGNAPVRIRVGFAPSNQLLIHTSFNYAMFNPEEPIDLLLMIFGEKRPMLRMRISSFLFMNRNFQNPIELLNIIVEGLGMIIICHLLFK